MNLSNWEFFCVILYFQRFTYFVGSQESEPEDTTNVTILIPTPTPDPRLRKILRKDYDRVALPFSEYSIGTTVEVSFTVTYINIREHEQTLEIHGWPMFSWLDPRLKWDSEEEQEGYVHFHVDEIWVPDLVVYNCARPEKIEYYGRTNCMVNSSGVVFWMPPSRIDTYCTIDILRWPRDIQQCSVKFGSWSYHEKQVDVTLGYLKLNEDLDWDNAEWILTSMSGRRDSQVYPCCPRDPYSSILFEFELKRRASGYFYSVVMPIALMCCLNVLVFWLPAVGGERITLGGINFLASLLLLMFVRTQLPNANRVPYIVMLCGWNMVLAAFGMITTIVVSCSERLTSTYTLPQFVRVAYRPTILAFFCVGPVPEPPKKQKKNSLKGSYKLANLSPLVRRSTDDQVSAEEALREREMAQNKAEWALLGSLIDRASFLVYGLVSLFLMCGLL
ncbi:unnamed protein product [Allacma fusca]|uniref:Uncharacterized protein n=1 Tax=Allacma fusca TaxID=39272 RepID=A0A8J2PNG9_9HEXA|nr:unnamed protein product [Allacma fusca]